MDNYNNPIEEEKIEAPVAEETPVVETPVEVIPEPVKEEETPKVEETKEEPVTITTSDFGRSTQETPAVGSVANGAIGVTAAPKPVARKVSAKKTEEAPEKVAIHSTKNVTWEGVGKVYRGYNIVTKEASEKWLTRSHTRIATPEEVAKEFGK